MAACEIVWVRCNEPAGPLLSLVRRTGQRLSIVDKCDTNRQASPTMRARNSARRLFNGTIVSADPGSADAAHAAAVARRLRVRDMWESGQEHALSDYHTLRHPANPLGAAQVADAARGGGFSACVPLVWLPAWLMNFGESLVASLLPIDELQEARLIDGRVLLTPELWRCGVLHVPLPRTCGHPPPQGARPRAWGDARGLEERPRPPKVA